MSCNCRDDNRMAYQEVPLIVIAHTTIAFLVPIRSTHWEILLCHRTDPRMILSQSPRRHYRGYHVLDLHTVVWNGIGIFCAANVDRVKRSDNIRARR